MIEIRRLAADELPRIGEIDRSERVRIGYRQEAEVLIPMPVVWDIPDWFEGDGAHGVGRVTAGTLEDLAAGGTAIAAFEDDRLVALAVYRPRLRPATGQLAFLHVSCSHRRLGIASRLFDRVVRRARADGATSLYVSATPSESAVGFYLSKGFLPTGDPDPRLLEEEPDDIHMLLEF